MILPRPRLVLIALGLIRTSIGKFFMVVTLVSVCAMVFVVIQEFARASTASLDASVTRDLGELGTYRVDISSSLTLPAPAIDRVVEITLHDFTVRPIAIVDVLGSMDVDCDPGGTLGETQLFVVRTESGFAPSGLAPREACIGGIDIATFARPTAESEKRSIGDGLVIDPALERTASLLIGRPPQQTFLVSVGTDQDVSAAMTTALTEALAGPAARNASSSASAVSVHRLDAGSGVRQAAQGVRLVYVIVAWAILLIGALAILLTEMANVRERNWLFGLARALGATRLEVILLVIVDVALVLLSGGAVVWSSLVIISAPLRSYIWTSFGVRLDPGGPQLLSQVALGVVVLLIIGSALPAARASRLEPIDILEKR